MTLTKVCPTCRTSHDRPFPADCKGCGVSLMSVRAREVTPDDKASIEGIATPAASVTRTYCSCISPKRGMADSGYCDECSRPISEPDSVCRQGAGLESLLIEIEGLGQRFCSVLPYMIGRSSCAEEGSLEKTLSDRFPGVSEKHCVLVSESNSVSIMDLKSSNGTFVRANDAWLKVGVNQATGLSLPTQIKLGKNCILSIRSPSEI